MRRLPRPEKMPRGESRPSTSPISVAGEATVRSVPADRSRIARSDFHPSGAPHRLLLVPNRHHRRQHGRAARRNDARGERNDHQYGWSWQQRSPRPTTRRRRDGGQPLRSHQPRRQGRWQCPATAPPPIVTSASRMTSQIAAERVAPSAMRMPISCVRCVTTNDITPNRPTTESSSATRRSRSTGWPASLRTASACDDLILDGRQSDERQPSDRHPRRLRGSEGNAAAGSLAPSHRRFRRRRALRSARTGRICVPGPRHRGDTVAGSR